MFTTETANEARQKGLATRRKNAEYKKVLEQALVDQKLETITDFLSQDMYHSVLETIGIVDLTPDQKRELALALIKELSVSQYKSKLNILEKMVAHRSTSKALHEMTFSELLTGKRYEISELATSEMKSKFNTHELLKLYEQGRSLNEHNVEEKNRLL
ncbi:TPA: hypothetical protein NG675_004971 [Vibrio parahaemolyticus]|nr:hypothetical protein [Vibrio parahaemolyticus]HCE2814412.1 hypothetical protein [Vibrio parahaemolyticus]HCE2818707.1 hypothetical protein [Vibrio parahaemolyticus]HCG5303162.1 hypothetical protein [Vibrio parahaemolyticus]HCG5307355.1 hypothetical protein [Vibrio parahaemolyticus]